MALLFAGFAPAAFPALDLSKGPYQALQNARYLQVTEPLTLAQVRGMKFRDFGTEQVNQGIGDAYHWLHFVIHNPKDDLSPWILRGETTYLDELTIYWRDDPTAPFQVARLSDREPFRSRPIDYRTLSFPGETPAGGSTEIYLLAHQSKADSVSLRFSIHDPAHFDELVREENLTLGAFYGALLLMILLAILVGVLLRQSNAYKYALFLGATLMLWLMLNGYGFQYLWPRAVYWHNEGFHLVYLLFVWAGLEFSKGFLQLKQLAPRWYKAFGIIQCIALFAMVLRLAGFYEVVLHVAFLLMSCLGILIIAGSWLAYRRGLKYALWSMFAWILYSLGLQASLVSAYTATLQWGMDALFFTQAGSLLETLFLMIAMAKWLVEMDTDRKLAHAMAHEDPLTGLGNRRRLQSAFESFAAEATKDQTVFLIMLDIDLFKQINDRFGHDAGDCVLRSVGTLLRRVCRKGDLAVRFGGEEFALVINADNAETAWRIAERIRQEFTNHPTRYGEQSISHTLCCGIAEIHSPRVQLSAQEMMQRADAALYQAKAAGRNQSHLYNPDSESISAPEAASAIR